VAQFRVLDTNVDDEVAKLVSEAEVLGCGAAVIESVIKRCGGDIERALEVSQQPNAIPVLQCSAGPRCCLRSQTCSECGSQSGVDHFSFLVRLKANSRACS
jgi:hypothetical protein